MLQVIIEILALIIFEFARAVLEPKLGRLVERATSDAGYAIDDVLCWLAGKPVDVGFKLATRAEWSV